MRTSVCARPGSRAGPATWASRDICLGRLDGLNERGLCVTLSAVWNRVPEDWAEPHGLHYAIAVRSALNHCQTVEEAVEGSGSACRLAATANSWLPTGRALQR